jgi:hypothetical protein
MTTSASASAASADAMRDRRAEHANVFNLPHRADRGDLGERLPTDTDDAERAGFRLGQDFGRHAARRTGAHLAEMVGLNHRFQTAIACRVEQHMKPRAIAADKIGLQPEQRFGAPGRAHQIEGAAAHRRALPRQIDRCRVGPGREQVFERGNGVLDCDQPADVVLGQIDRSVRFKRTARFDFVLRCCLSFQFWLCLGFPRGCARFLDFTHDLSSTPLRLCAIVGAARA